MELLRDKGISMSDDARLKNDRLVFYRDVIERINKVLEIFLARSKSKCAILIDKEGHLITMHGENQVRDMDTVCTLLAGTFAATREWARLLGEQEFSGLFHEGKQDSIQVVLVEDRTLLAVVFDQRETQLGLVRLMSTEVVKKLAQIFEEAMARDDPGDEEFPDIDTEGARKALEEIFPDI